MPYSPGYGVGQAPAIRDRACAGLTTRS
jgi:hypothetical protein